MTIKSKAYFTQTLRLTAISLLLTACMYTPPVDQGKHLTGPQIHALKIHMRKHDVKKLLGEPVIHSQTPQTWQYVDFHYTQKRQTRHELVLSFNKKDQLIKAVTKGGTRAT